MCGQEYCNFSQSDECTPAPPPRWIPAGTPSGDPHPACDQEPYDINDGGLLPRFRGQPETKQEFVPWLDARSKPYKQGSSLWVIPKASHSLVKASENREAYQPQPLNMMPPEKPWWSYQFPLKPLCRCHESSLYRDDYCTAKLQTRRICMDKTPLKKEDNPACDSECQGDGVQLPPDVMIANHVTSLLYRSVTSKDFTHPSAWEDPPCHPPDQGDCPAPLFATSVPCDVHHHVAIEGTQPETSYIWCSSN